METKPTPEDNPPGEKPPEEKTPPADLRDFLIAALALAPAEGTEAVSDDQIREALSAAVAAGSAAGEDLGGLQQQVEELKTQLSDLQMTHSELQTKYQAAEEELGGIKQGAEEAEIEKVLAPFADRISDDAAKTAIRDLLKTNREAGMAILNGLQAAPADPDKANPPAPMHDPGSEEDTVADETAVAAAISKRAKELQASESITFTAANSFARPHRRACRGWKNWRYMAGDICGPFCIPRSSPNTITSRYGPTAARYR